MDMPLRIIGYDGSSYRDEMNQDEIVIDEITGKKHKIRHARYPVVTIVLYFGKTPWKKPLSLYDVLKISDELKPFVNDYKINLIDVPRLTGEQVEKFTSDFQIIADYFVQLNESNDYVPKEKTIKHADSFLKLMSVLTQDDKYAEISREISHDEEGFNMCDVLDRVEARGMEKTRKEMILNMLKENISVDTIARVAKLTADQVIAIGKNAAVL